MPQIELMMSDLPHPLYINKKSGSEKSYSQSEIDEAAALTMAAMEQKRRHPDQQEAKTYTLDEVFNGDAD